MSLFETIIDDRLFCFCYGRTVLSHQYMLNVYFHSYVIWDDVCPPARNDKFHVSFVHGDKANKVMFIVF
jgi:hypothetical protein